MLLGGILLSATAVAGLFLRYQLRLTNDVANSARALFAADGELEWASYCVIFQQEAIKNITTPAQARQVEANLDCSSITPEPTFTGATASYEINITFIQDNPKDVRISTEGFSGKAVRGVETIFSF